MKSNNDPIAEADVYRAYGRTAQAAEILQQALKAQPERATEFQAKLMEIQQTPSTETIRGEMPKVIWIPIAASIINFLGIAMLDWSVWPGAVLLVGILFGVVWWLHTEAKQQALLLRHKETAKEADKNSI
jgi:Flp pilus assembly protein TadB